VSQKRHCNTLQHTATHCNTLQHIATHCHTLQHTATPLQPHRNTQGFSPLMVASGKGHVHAMLLLIDRGAKIDAKNQMVFKV